MSKYLYPKGLIGIGSDIKWCGKNSGGKHCLFCKKYAKYNEWSNDWKWYYLIEWSDYDYNFFMEHVSYHCWTPWNKTSWRGRYTSFRAKKIKPARYCSRGLTDNDIKSLMLKGCKPNRKCKCVSIIQRGNWYCPECYNVIEEFSKIKNCNIHDIMIKDPKELRNEFLIMRLSGIL